MGWLNIDTYDYTSFVQEIANHYSPDLSVSAKTGHKS